MIVDPNNAHSILSACGLGITQDIKIISFKTLFERLHKIPHSQFDQDLLKFCEALSLSRNAELHSGESPFSGTKHSLEKYWHVTLILLRIQKKNLDSWLGAVDEEFTLYDRRERCFEPEYGND